MIFLNNLSYNISNYNLFKNISLTILPGALVQIFGSNGSGKTTLLRMIAGIQKPQSGSIIIENHNGNSNISYIGHNLGIKDDITVSEQLEFWAGIYGAKILMASAIRYCRLEDYLDSYCYKLSAGNRQKLAITKLILSNAMIWVLDEIDSALDEENSSLLKNLLITKANSGGIVIYSSHRKQLPCSFVVNIGDYNG